MVGTKHVNDRSVNKPITCEICWKNFSSKSSLSMHKRVHKGKKPLKCNVCDKNFTWKGKLNQHILVHSSKKDFNVMFVSYLHRKVI